jgi:hypothetical protein
MEMLVELYPIAEADAARHECQGLSAVSVECLTLPPLGLA